MKTKFRYRNNIDTTWSFGCVYVPKELFGNQVINYLRDDLQKLGIKAKYVELEK